MFVKVNCNDCGKMLHCPDTYRKTRYFTKASSAPVDGTKSGEKHISQYIELSNRALRQGKYEDCVASLESGLEKQPASEVSTCKLIYCGI